MRERILDVAAMLFMSKGVKRTTITEIAHSLQRQKSSIYYYYPNKEAIFMQIAEIEAELLLDGLSDAVRGIEDPLDALRKYMQQRIYHMHHVSGRYRKLKDELFELLPMIELARKEAYLTEIKLVEEMLLRGIEQGIFTVFNAQLMAKLIVNSMKGYEIPMYISNEIGYNPIELEQLLQLFIYGLLKR